MVPAACSNDLGAEIAGVLIEELNFAAEFARTGQPVCQGPPSRCGPPGIFALIIPDCPLGVACFGDSCNEHDRCYGTCGTSKDVCDDRFLENLLGVCSELTSEDDETLRRCEGLAFIYWQAVVRFGQIAFDIAQDVNCACLGVTPNRDLAAGAKTLGKPVPPIYPQFSMPVPEFYPFDDLDDDLMPDVWEREVGLDAENAADAWEDPDSDGILNLEEFILGSDPFTANQYRPGRGGG